MMRLLTRMIHQFLEEQYRLVAIRVAALDHKRADAFRSTKLVSRDKRHLRVEPVECHGKFAKSLCRVRDSQPRWQLLNNAGFGICDLKHRVRGIRDADLPVRGNRQIGRDPSADRIMFNVPAVQIAPRAGKRRRFGRA